jgi:hypothetical protein
MDVFVAGQTSPLSDPSAHNVLRDCVSAFLLLDRPALSDPSAQRCALDLAHVFVWNPCKAAERLPAVPAAVRPLVVRIVGDLVPRTRDLPTAKKHNTEMRIPLIAAQYEGPSTVCCVANRTMCILFRVHSYVIMSLHKLRK